MDTDLRCRYFYQIQVLKKGKEYNYSGFLLHEEAWLCLSLGDNGRTCYQNKIKEETSKDFEKFLKELKN